MGHPRQLLEKITAIVQAQYPVDAGFEYQFERAIAGTRMMPDLLVTHDGTLVCAVEIGYTRPEKLTAYRDLGIPDVRWYDKQGVLHADVKNEVRVVELEPQGVLAVYRVLNAAACVGCDSAEGEPRRVPELAEDRYIRRFGFDAFVERQGAAAALEALGVTTLVVTDYILVWYPSACDKCGRAWLADPDDEDGTCSLIGPSDFQGGARYVAATLGRRELMPWSQARCLFGLDFRYQDGYEIVAGSRSTILAGCAVPRRTT